MTRSRRLLVGGCLLVGTVSAAGAAPKLPLVRVADVDLPGRATRFDYQAVDASRGHLVLTHMNDASVVVVKLSDGSVVKTLGGIPVARGVAVAEDIGVIFVTSSPSSLVRIDAVSLTEIGRVEAGNGPDGVDWDPKDQIVGVSDQRDGALSLIFDKGKGTRKQVKLGRETGNAIFDAGRGWFWITVVGGAAHDQLVAVSPTNGNVKAKLGLPGCEGAHGLRIHPDGRSAFVACEDNGELARVDLDGEHRVAIGRTGADPDVLAIDPGLGWLYVGAESGDLTVFDIAKPGVALLGHDHPGPATHSVAVDRATHHVFFPLMRGPKGTPVLRILRPG